MPTTKHCPYCAEDIKMAAVVCKHCGRELPGFEELSSDSVVTEKSRNTRNKSNSNKKVGEKSVIKTSVVIGFIFAFLSIFAAIYASYDQVTGLFLRTFWINLILYPLSNFIFFYLSSFVIITVKNRIGWSTLIFVTIGLAVLIMLSRNVNNIAPLLAENSQSGNPNLTTSEINNSATIQPTIVPTGTPNYEATWEAIGATETSFLASGIENRIPGNCIYAGDDDLALGSFAFRDYGNESYCIWGLIGTKSSFYSSLDGNPPLYFTNEGNHGYIFNFLASPFRFGHATIYQPNFFVGDCVIVTGRVVELPLVHLKTDEEMEELPELIGLGEVLEARSPFLNADNIGYCP
jgi:hypothetical protein